MNAPNKLHTPLIDGFGRTIRYLRLSVTDRCDFRCTYCMAEDMTFLPKSDVLSIDELIRLGRIFISLGVDKIRLTGGEPLVRRGIREVIAALGTDLKKGSLLELTLTTNGSQLVHFVDDLVAAGIRRVNVSLDTLNAEKFHKITRRGDLMRVLQGIQAARDAGLRVKINTVAIKGENEDELSKLLAWCVAENMDLTLIETMPMGIVQEDRFDQYLPLDMVKERLAQDFAMTPSTHKTGGPARYFDIAGRKSRLGLITPLTNNFCDGCNRVRVTTTGRLYFCLGQDEHIDLRALMRQGSDRDVAIAIRDAMGIKPKGHDFAISKPGSTPAQPRHMNVTGG